MRKVTLEEIEQLASDARESIWAQAKTCGHDPLVILHWTAGHYGQAFDDYHICINEDGSLNLMRELDDPSPHGAFHCNTGVVQISMEGCYGSGSNGLGDEPPTEAQIEAMAQAIAVISEGLWITIDKNHVLTHGEEANDEAGLGLHLPYSWWNDGYGDGDTRGDLEYLGTPESPSYNPYATDGSRGGDVLRGKANFYANQRKANG